MRLIINWLISALAVIVTAYLLRGVSIDSFVTALIVALVLGIINTFIRPVLLIFTLPINIITLGLFTLAINAILIMFTAMFVNGFSVASFWWALLFGLVLSIVNFVLNLIFPRSK